MDPPDPDAMGIDLWDPTATAQGADSSSVESETSSEDVLKHFGVSL